MSQSDVVRTIEWTLLFVQLPGREPLHGGVLVVDRGSDELLVRLRPALNDKAPEEAIEIWSELAKDLLERSHQHGGVHVLHWLETTASHFIQIGARHSIKSSNPRETLDFLYKEHVATHGIDGELRRRAAL